MGQKFAYFQIEVKQMPTKFAKFTLWKGKSKSTQPREKENLQACGEAKVIIFFFLGSKIACTPLTSL